MKGKLTASLLLALSIGFGLNLTASFHKICAITLEKCCGGAESHDATCSSGCCEMPGEQDCCFLVPENEPVFVLPSAIRVIEAPFLADLPRETDNSCQVGCSPIAARAKVYPDPPPRSGRLLLSLVERLLI